LPQAIGAPEPLSPEHQLDAFDCGNASLNEWLTQRAVRNEAEGASRSFVIHVGRRVVGYYSLAATSIEHSVATGRTRRNMPDPVPAVLLARLAIDVRHQGEGLGAELLIDAVKRTLHAGKSIGIRAILVHAISEAAKRFYEKFGFRASAIEPATLMVTVEELQRVLAKGRF
jgi:GNAT superfamily N-acetyltransferase